MMSQNLRNWIFERKLGSGGFGQVELWREKFTNKKIAIKRCLRPRDALTQRQIERWTQEIENIQNFKHPNIIKSEPIPPELQFESPVLCMEYCNKGDLRRVLNQPENACGLMQNEVLSIMKDISSAIKFLHFNEITHRDIKPENVVLQEKNGMMIYKLIDLGYAKELGSSTMTASLVGTISYVAPEIFWKRRYTQSVDYWSLGMLFFEVLTGYKPFAYDAENVPRWIMSLKNKKQADICARKIEKDIQYYDYIIYPNDLSENLLNGLLEWFQIALKFIPKQRGKRPGSDKVVIFDVLREIFPWKTILVFSVFSYQLDQFYMTSDSTILELQQWIEIKTSLKIHEQVIATSTGLLLNEIDNSQKLSIQNLADYTLYVYKNNDLVTIESDNDYKMPEILDRMLTEPKAIGNRLLLRECFTAIIYVLRCDTLLFKHYVFAFGIKLDIMQNKLKTLSASIRKSSSKAELLLNKVNQVVQSVENCRSQDVMDSLKYFHDKIQNLRKRIESMRLETDHFKNEITELFDSDILLDDLKKCTGIYEGFLTMFRKFETDNNITSDTIVDKVNLLSSTFDKFFEQKIERLQKPETLALARKLVNFEKKLYIYCEGNNSSIKLIQSYEDKISGLINITDNFCDNSHNATVSHSNELLNQSSLVTSSNDAAIKDSIVLRAIIRHSMDKFIRDIQQVLTEVQMDPNS